MKGKIARSACAVALSAAMCLTLLPAVARAEDKPWGWWMEYGEGWHTDEDGNRFYVDEYGNIHWDTGSGGAPSDPGGNPSGSTQSGKCGADITWTLNEDTGVLELKGSGEMGSEYFLGYPLYNLVKTIRISDGITSIGDHAFSGTRITSIDLPGSVTHIGEGAFRDTPLVSITIPDSVTSIDKWAFQNCGQLERVSLPSGLTHIPAGLFSGCKSLKGIEIPASVRSIGDSGGRPTVEGAFYYAGLTSVVIPEGVERIENETFYGCKDLASVTIPDSVTYIGQRAFDVCAEGLTIYGYTGSTAETVVKEDYHGTSVAFVSLGMSAHADPELKAGFVIQDGELTKYQGGGGHADIPDGVWRIGDGAFQGAKLTGVTIPGSVTHIGSYAFAQCAGLTSVTIPKSVTWIGEKAFESGVTLRGGAGSYAETYAKENGLAFEAADGARPAGDAPGLEGASDWARETVNGAYRAGLIPAALQGRYTQTATRAEFCALAATLYETVTGTEITGRAVFSDTTDESVGKMAALGVVTGVGGGRFDPDGRLTREQAATMLARLADTLDLVRPAVSTAVSQTANAAVETVGGERTAKLLPASAPTFSDNAAISSWAFDAVGRVQAAGVMRGVENNSFAPQREYTREQSILTMMRLFEIVR